MEENKQTTELVKALGIFQSECPAIKKDSKAGQGNFSYKYGSLPMILEVIKPHMKKAGLAFTQPIVSEDEKEFIVTTLYETKTGGSIQSKMELPVIEFKGMNVLQAKGSVITYLRRYAIMAILGIVAEEDDNDGAGEAKQVSKPSNKPASKPAQAQNKKAEAPWLNPEENGKVNPKWQEACKYLADGGKIADIKKKYRMSKVNEEKLLSDSLAFDDLPFDRKDAEELNNLEGIGSNELQGGPGEPEANTNEAVPGQSNLNFDKQGPTNE